MVRLLVAGFVSTVFGAFEFFDAMANHEPEMYVVFFALTSNTAQDGPPASVAGANDGSPGRSFALNGMLALGLVALGWLTGRVIPHLGHYRLWILPLAWLAWVAAYRVIPSVSMALAVLIVFAIAAPHRDPSPISQPPVC